MSDRTIHVDFGVWGVVRKVAITCLVLAILGGLVLWCIPVVQQGQRLQKEIDLKKESLRRQQELHAQYTDEIFRLRNDPDYIERTIRIQTKKVKPGDELYRFESNKTAN
jgi:cell division protein FtsB